MFDYGDDLTISATFSIPWLLWIQILILLLLLLLLVFFGFLSSDLAESGPSSSLSSEISLSVKKPAAPVGSGGTSFIASPALNSQVGGRQSLKGGIAQGTSRRVCLGRVEAVDTEGCESKETNHMPLHPCHYFRLAKLAFLKCLGLDPLRHQ